MFILKILFIFLIIKYLNSCNLFETRKVCECGASYSIGSGETLHLFDLPSIEKCGFNMDCSGFDCGQVCLDKVREILGGRADYITISGRNKICDLISSGKPLFRNGITFWADWKYSGCESGSELILTDLCCNRQCKCNIVSQVVSSNGLNENFKVVEDLTKLLPIKEKSYDCSLSELEDCQAECMDIVGDYFDQEFIKSPNKHPEILNYNIFYEQFAAKKICTKLDKAVPKPGIDIYAEIDASENNYFRKFISLGRICCKKTCQCQYVFKDAYNFANKVAANAEIIRVSDLNLGYDCSEELSDCMIYCRENAFSRLLITEPHKDLKKPMEELKPLDSNSFGNYFCQEIGNIKNDPNDPNKYEKDYGYDIYLRSKVNNIDQSEEKFPTIEDFHLGRICCRKNLEQYEAGYNCIFN